MIENNMGNLSLTGQCIPPLRTGEYEVSAKISLKFSKTEETSLKEAKRFFVQGQRFTMKQEQIESVYPAPGECCSHSVILPHVVVSPCTLPFECAVLPDGESSLKTPYLALLLFHDDEMPQLIHGSVRDLFKSPGNGRIFYPEDYTKEEEDFACTFMDVPGDLFAKIAPAADELAFLVHGRKSNSQLKAKKLMSLSVKEVQSVIFCNRIPRSGNSKEPYLNHVCLVSLAGCSRIWEDGTNCPAVRLAVLYHWEFFALEETAGEELLQSVHTKSFTLPVPETAGKNVRELLQNGYVPLEHTLREGSRTVSFYRGPFVPAHTHKTVQTKDSPDSLYRYDPEIGMFDVSYACAWEIGKLTALSREDIARKIMMSRNAALNRMHKEEVQEMLSNAGVKEDINSQLLHYFEKCFGEKKDEIMVSEGTEDPD